MGRVHVEPCPKCGGNTGITAHLDMETYLLKWSVGCAECGIYGRTYFISGDDEENRSNLKLAAEEWNAMCEGWKEESE